MPRGAPAVSWWLAVLLAAAAGALGYAAGRRRRWRRPAPNLPIPADAEQVLDLARRAHRAVAAVLCRAGGMDVRSTHPRGVPAAVVERALATARLALANDQSEVVPDPPAVVAAATEGVAVGLAFDQAPTPDAVERARVDAWRLAAGFAQAARPAAPTPSRWSGTSWLEIPETVEAAAAAICANASKAVARGVALVLRDDLRGTLRIARTSPGVDPRLTGASALPDSAVARAIASAAPVAATTPEQLFGHPQADRRRGERQGMAFPVLDGRVAVGALVVFGPPASLPPEARTDVERMLGGAAARLAHLQAIHVEETRARTDELTGLANRRGLRDTLSAWSGAEAVLLILDLDHFKRLNDTFGHVAGDAALHHLAGVLRRALREVDLAARIGGEEFALWLPDTPADAGVDVAERVRAAVERTPVRWQGRTIPFTCSIGVAALPGATGDLANLYAVADAALYRAKQGGRNRVEVARRTDLPALADHP